MVDISEELEGYVGHTALLLTLIFRESIFGMSEWTAERLRELLSHCDVDNSLEMAVFESVGGLSSFCRGIELDEF